MAANRIPQPPLQAGKEEPERQSSGNDSPRKIHLSPVRWLLFLAVLVVLAIGLTGQWTRTTSTLFMALVAISLAAGVWSASRADLLRNPVWVAQALSWIEPRRAALSQGTALLAVGLLAWSAYLFRPEDLAHHRVLATWLVIPGGLILGVALRLQPRLKKNTLTRAIPTDSASKPLPFIIHRRAFALGVIGILLFAEMSARTLNIGLLNTVSLHIQFLLLCLSAGLIVWGLSDGRWTRGWPGFFSVEIPLLLLVAGVGFFLRFWGLDSTIRTLVDEVHFSSGVVRIWASGNDIGLMQPMTKLSPFPWIYPYWQAQAAELFGRNLTGMRAASSVLGTLNILALYLMVRAFFDRKTALLAAVIVMAFPPHVHFSRVAIPQIADPLFATLGFAFIGRGLRDNRRTDYALGGAGIAFSQYFYEAGRILFPPLAVLWVVGVAVLWSEPAPKRVKHRLLRLVRRVLFPFSQGRMRAHVRGLLTALVVFLLLSIPVYYTLAAMGFPVYERFRSSSLNNVYWESVLGNGKRFTVEDQKERLKAPWLFYVSQPETGSVYYGGTQPLVLSAIVPLFLLGVFHAVWRLRAPGMLLLILMLLATSFGNSLLVGSAVASRYLVIYPTLALFIALGIRYTLPLVWPKGQGSRVYRYALIGGLVIGVVVIQVAYYFGPHLEAYQVQSRPHRDIQDAVLRSVDFPPGTRVHIVAEPLDDGGYGNDMLSFFADGMILDAMLPEEVDYDYVMALQRGVDHAFFVVPADTETVRKLREYLVLEGPSLSPYPMPPRKQYALYFAPHDKNPDTIGRTLTGTCGAG